MNQITTNKLTHIREVSLVMAETAQRLGWDEEAVEDAAVLGFVHDIGYLVCKEGHAKKGAEMLERRGYDLADDVRDHGHLVENPTPELALLWHADMSVDAQGRRVDYYDRLADIRRRYGADSAVTSRAEAIVAWLNAHFPAIGKPQHNDVPDDDDAQLARQVLALETPCPKCGTRMRLMSVWRDDGMLCLYQRCPDCGHDSEERFDAI